MPLLKQHMDFFFWKHPKAGREFQQLAAWENNRAGIASETEYFITDIEYATDIVRDGATKRVRLDMLGLKWLRKRGEDGSSCAPVFIEMKYGIKALGGKAGIRDHVDDLESLLENESTRAGLSQMIENQFKQLASMEHIKLNEGRLAQNVKLVDKPEVILLLSNCSPRGNALRNALDKVKKHSSFELRFFVANYAGYAMHDACMMDLDEFKRRLDRTAD